MIISPAQQAWWFIDNTENIIPYEGYRNYRYKENEEPLEKNHLLATITKSKKRRLKQFFNMQKIVKTIDIKQDIQPLKSFGQKSRDEKMETQIPKEINNVTPPESKNITPQKEFEFKIPLIKTATKKPVESKKEVVRESKKNQEELCESILQFVHSNFMVPITPVSPIKNTPPQKKELVTKN